MKTISVDKLKQITLNHTFYFMNKIENGTVHDGIGDFEFFLSPSYIEIRGEQYLLPYSEDLPEYIAALKKKITLLKR